MSNEEIIYELNSRFPFENVDVLRCHMFNYEEVKWMAEQIKVPKKQVSEALIQLYNGEIELNKVMNKYGVDNKKVIDVENSPTIGKGVWSTRGGVI